MTNRRLFLQQTAGAAVAASLATAAVAAKARREPRKFQLKYAPHFGMFKEHAGPDPIAQLEFMAAQGFTALEDNGLMGRPVELQERIGATLARLGMTMGVFVIDGGDNWKTSLTTGKPEFHEKFLATCRTAVEVGKRVNARWATVVPGYFERELPIGIQTGHVVDTLRAGAEILAPHNLTMVLEPLSDNPDLFLRTSDQAYAICRAVDSPACKILYDMYHMQRNEGDIIQHIDLAWSEIAYFQIGDNPGRKEPGTGEMNYKNLFRHIARQRLQRRVRHGTRQREAGKGRRAGTHRRVRRRRFVLGAIHEDISPRGACCSAARGVACAGRGDGTEPPTLVPLDIFSVPEGLEVTVWAQSPMLKNPTNIDIDAAGRIWVTEGVNYRRHKERDPKGDRVMVLEDTDGDGRADKATPFVQEPTLVAPLGMAVIGNKVIVSNAPDLIVYTDVDGDRVFNPAVDKREVLLTGFDGRNHDHALHSVTFGPDGRWYFSQGNAGAHFTDRGGKTFRVGSAYNPVPDGGAQPVFGFGAAQLRRREKR